MERVVVTNPMVGFCHMQVCALSEATDEEILEVCNSVNPSGTTGGWSHVIREDEEPDDFWATDKQKPVQCSNDPSRKHFLVAC